MITFVCAAITQVASDLQAQQYAHPADISNAVTGSQDPGVAGGLAADLTLGSVALVQSAQVRCPPPHYASAAF